MTLAWPVNPLWNKIYSPYQSLDIGYSPNGSCLFRGSRHYYQRVHNLSSFAVERVPIRRSGRRVITMISIPGSSKCKRSAVVGAVVEMMWPPLCALAPNTWTR